MATTSYIRHRDLLSVPTAAASFIVGESFFGGWWYGVALMLLSLLLFQYPYRIYFSEYATHPRRKSIATNLLFVGAQIVFWSLVFWAIHVSLR